MYSFYIENDIDGAMVKILTDMADCLIPSIKIQAQFLKCLEELNAIQLMTRGNICADDGTVLGKQN